MSDHVSSPNESQTNRRQPLSDQEERLRAQESTLLNVWTQQGFFLLGGCVALLLMLVFVVGAGGPPSDPRCTLPWC